MFLILVFIVVCILIYIYVLKPHKYWKNQHVKHIKPTIILGSLYDNVSGKKSFPDILNDTYKTFKDERYFGWYQMLEPILVIKDLELIKKITIKDFNSFVDHQDHISNDVDPMWGKNLFSMTGEPWRDMRATLSPAFTSSKMKTMFYLVDECVNDLIKHILDKNEEIVTVELKEMFTRTANDCIASSAFGLKCNSLAQPNNEFFLNAKEAFDFSGIRRWLFFMLTVCPSVMKFFGLKMINDKMSNYFQSVIKETIKSRQEQGIIRPDMLHLMLEARKGRLNTNDNSENIGDSFASVSEQAWKGEGTKKKIDLTDFDITAQALVFYFGGFDTTSFLTCFVCYELAVNIDIQERLRQEVDVTLKECNGKLNYEALMKMKYLDMILSEALRKWSPATILGRYCTKEYVIEPEREGEKRLVVPRGSNVWIPTYAIHRDPKYYPNPDKFDPERFSAENKSKINNLMYVPFGLGPRNCIGSRFALMENKAIIFHLLTKFQIVPVKKTVIPLVLSTKYLNCMSEGGFWIGFKRLNSL